MTQSTVPNFLHLNSDGCWPAFQSCGLDHTADGAFRLAALPALATPVLPSSPRPPKPAGPAGIVVEGNGTVFFSDPDGHRVLMWNPADAEPQPMPCLDDTNADCTGLSQPRGLAIHPRRNALLVADAGHGRILLISLASLRLSEVWELPAEGQPAEPWSLAVDDAGSVYVIDNATRSVRKFDLYGRECESFRRRVDEGLAPDSPSQIGPQPTAAVFVSHNRPALYVLDTAGRALVEFDPDGNLLARIDLPHVGDPAGLAVTRDGLYVGDNASGRLLRLDDNGNVVGHAPDYEGWVAQLAVDGDGGLWLHPGGSGTVLRFSLPDRTTARASDAVAFVQRGFFWGGPFEAGETEVDWHRLRAAGPPLPVNSQFQFYVFTANRRGVQPPAFGSAAAERAWKPLPRGGDVLVRERSRSLWIAGVLEGDGRVSPQIDQVRVEFDHETYSRYLPEIYRTGPERADLDRFLSLIESFFVDVQQEIASLDQFFDADAAPADWLDWLAEWVALPPDEARPDEQTRRAIAGAFESYAWRGTKRGLLAALKRDAGVDARIDEPLAASAWWALPAADLYLTRPRVRRSQTLGSSMS
jgi:phage tail-like protein